MSMTTAQPAVIGGRPSVPPPRDIPATEVSAIPQRRAEASLLDPRSRLICRSHLNDVLADTQVVHALYKSCQWALPPLSFRSLHELVVWHAREQLDLTDQIAARVRDLHGVAIADPRRVAMRTDIPQPPGSSESITSMIQRLAQAHDTIAIRADNAAGVTGERGDEAGRAVMELVRDVNIAQAQTIGQYLQKWQALDTESTPAQQPPSASAALATQARDIVDEWGRQSFPASDPPANW